MAFWNKSSSTEWLSEVSFFEGFSDADLKNIARIGTEIEVDASHELTDQGDVGQVCYVVVDGQASVYVGNEHVATVGSGSMIGEMALLDRRPRSATVISDTPMKLLSFDVGGFDEMLSSSPDARARVMSILSGRLRDKNLA